MTADQQPDQERKLPSARPPASARLPAPPREADDQRVTAVIAAGWAIALIALLIAAGAGALPIRERWWIWTCVAGLGLGLFGLWYVPVLKRRRARATARG